MFTLPIWYGHGLAQPVISLSCLCKTEVAYSAFVNEPAFLVHWSSWDYAWRVDLFRIICIL